MSFKKLYELGYTDLVPVIPPSAEISSGSNITDKQKGKAPGKLGSNGWYGFSGWQKHATDLSDCEVWETWGANIGLRCDLFGAFDLDSMNERVADVIEAQAHGMLGRAPVRVGQAPKRLLLYRMSEPMQRIALKFSYEGEEHLLEWLGTGRQFVAMGIHHSGTPYRWINQHIMEIPAATLTEVTPTKVREFFHHLHDNLAPKVASIELIIPGEKAERETIVQTELLAPDDDTLAEMVARVRNDARFAERDEYIKMGMAIKAASRHKPTGLAIFYEWCMRWEDGDNAVDVVEADWGRMHAPFALGYSYIEDLARDGGVNTAVDDFEAEPLPADADDSTQQQAYKVDSDAAIVEAIANMFRGQFLYSPQERRTFVWDGSMWKPDQLDSYEWAVHEGMKALSSQEFDRAAIAPADKEKKMREKQAALLLTDKKFQMAKARVRRHPELVVPITTFDPDPWLLCTPGGEVNLLTGQFRDSDPESLCTMQTAVTPRVCEPTRWLAYLDRATAGNVELQDWLQMFMGYCLTGVPWEQVLAYLHGLPASGKSVFLGVMQRIMGSYATDAPMEVFLASRFDRHPTELAKLRGKRLVTTSETSEGRKWDEAKVKRLTAGDRISARVMRGDFFEFDPVFKLLVIGNHAPQLQNADGAMRRRLRMVPFSETIPKEEQDPKLEDYLVEEEGSSILYWMIQGCLRWVERNHKMPEPECVRLKTDAYFEEQDTMATFVEDYLVLGDGEEAPRDAMYNTWRTYCGRIGRKEESAALFARRLRSAISNIGTRKSDGTRIWTGVSIKQVEAEL
jgi:putative DNA primase/helicase